MCLCGSKNNKSKYDDGHKINSVMKKIFFLVVWIAIANITLHAQDKFFTKTGRISFSGKSTLSGVNAENKAVAVVLDKKTGGLQFSVLMKGFEFKKAVMQKHFNEKYLETDKFPKSEFKGEITNNALVKYATDGVYPLTAKGKLTIHGETKDVEANGTVTIKAGKPVLNSTFNILITDYKINANMNNKVTITVDCSLDPLQ
jgi:polyisoprenoid-binding protein YceI